MDMICCSLKALSKLLSVAFDVLKVLNFTGFEQERANTGLFNESMRAPDSLELIPGQGFISPTLMSEYQMMILR